MTAVEVRAFTFRHRERDPGPYTNVVANVGKRVVEMTVSPTERTFHVHVDGIRYAPAQPKDAA